MKTLRSKLTYANVMVTVLAFCVLGGGTAFAATQLPGNSVGTKQLKKGAVTPGKLSEASRSTLTGPSGPTGGQGPVGKEGPQGPIGATGKEGPIGHEGSPGDEGPPGGEGPPGPEGPQGPGAVTIEDTATSGYRTVTTFNGIVIRDHCQGGVGEIIVSAEPVANTLSVFGTWNSNATVNAVHSENLSSFTPSAANVDLDALARNLASGEAWNRLDLHMSGSNCVLTGMVIPSTVG
jgi:Collagen triple helix repeat (20 copies)